MAGYVNFGLWEDNHDPFMDQSFVQYVMNKVKEPGETENANPITGECQKDSEKRQFGKTFQGSNLYQPNNRGKILNGCDNIKWGCLECCAPLILKLRFLAQMITQNAILSKLLFFFAGYVIFFGLILAYLKTAFSLGSISALASSACAAFILGMIFAFSKHARCTTLMCIPEVLTGYGRTIIIILVGSLVSFQAMANSIQNSKGLATSLECLGNLSMTESTILYDNKAVTMESQFWNTFLGTLHNTSATILNVTSNLLLSIKVGTIITATLSLILIPALALKYIWKLRKTEEILDDIEEDETSCLGKISLVVKMTLQLGIGLLVTASFVLNITAYLLFRTVLDITNPLIISRICDCNPEPTLNSWHLYAIAFGLYAYFIITTLLSRRIVTIRKCIHNWLLPNEFI